MLSETTRRIALTLVLIFLVAACGEGENQKVGAAADGFFNAIAKQDHALAHRYLTNSLGKRTPVDALKGFIDATGLQHPGERTWQTTQINGENAVLTGEVEIGNGAPAVPLRLAFERQDTRWKISTIERGVRTTSANGTTVVYAPSAAEGVQLAQRTTAKFANAVQQGDLQPFWTGMADAFRQRFTAEQFSTAFSGFITDRANLAPAARLDPIFDAPPTIDPQGELLLRGVFPSTPSRLAFQYHYLWQDGEWRPSGITIDLVPHG